MMPPRFRARSVTIAAARGRAPELAEFYHRLLSWPITERGPDGGWLQLRPPPGEEGVTINIEEDLEYVAPTWPSRAGEQVAVMHLDVGVDDLDPGVAWAIEAGARLVVHQPQDDVRVLMDPHGHPFCLFT